MPSHSRPPRPSPAAPPTYPTLPPSHTRNVAGNSPASRVRADSTTLKASSNTAVTEERVPVPTTTVHLTDRIPRVSADELLAGFRPSERFGEVSFDTYIPDPNQPSQAEAVQKLKDFGDKINGGGSGGGFFGRLFGGKKKDTSKAGLYLDGGFGVGKTHLLASLWHYVDGPKAFGTFVEYTNLVGALTFRKTVEALSGYKLVCIDEFELDDPGDTVLMSRLMRELADAGVKLVATSNTLPGALGEGRFAAEDFKREIQVLSSQFEVWTVRTSVTVACPMPRSRCLTPSLTRKLRRCSPVRRWASITSRTWWITWRRCIPRVTVS